MLSNIVNSLDDGHFTNRWILSQNYIHVCITDIPILDRAIGVESENDAQ